MQTHAKTSETVLPIILKVESDKDRETEEVATCATGHLRMVS